MPAFLSQSAQLTSTNLARKLPAPSLNTFYRLLREIRYVLRRRLVRFLFPPVILFPDPDTYHFQTTKTDR